MTWISVTDRLPKEGSFVIVSTGDLLFSYFGRYCDKQDPMPSLPSWINWKDITHWMPVHEPPRKKI